VFLHYPLSAHFNEQQLFEYRRPDGVPVPDGGSSQSVVRHCAEHQHGGVSIYNTRADELRQMRAGSSLVELIAYGVDCVHDLLIRLHRRTPYSDISSAASAALDNIALFRRERDAIT
jgi:hypothetical protein